MKTLKNLCVFTAILLLSCNSTDDLVLDLYDQTNPGEIEETYNKNPFDELGNFYQKLSGTSNVEDINIGHVQKQLNHTLASNNIQILKSKSRAPFESSPKEFSLSDPTLPDLIDNSSLSQSTKTRLLEFTNDLIAYNGKNIEFVLPQINAFELVIIKSNLTSYDQQAILTFTALVKSTVKSKDITMELMSKEDEDDDKEKENQRDEDWDISIPHMSSFLLIAFSQTTEEMARELLKSLKTL